MRVRRLLAPAAGVALAFSTLASCSHAVTTQAEAVAKIESGQALNERSGEYRAGDVTVELTKVVRLPDDELGFRFSFPSESPHCCSVFPRTALLGNRPDYPSGSSTYVMVPDSFVGRDGTLDMRLSKSGGSTVPFTVDLGALGVPLP